MTLRELSTRVRLESQRYPHLAEDLAGLLQLCHSEIEEGGSPQQEIDSCHHDISELIEEWESASAQSRP